MKRAHCLGSHLSPLEARIALQGIVAAVASYEVDVAGARRIRLSNNRGFASLPTQFTVR